MADSIIRAEDFIDTTDLGNIDKIIDGLDRFNKALDENAKIRKDNAEDLSKIRKKEIADLKKLETQLEATKNTTEEGRQETIKLTNAAEEKAKAMEKLVGVEKDNEENLRKISKLEKQVLSIRKALLKVIKERNKNEEKGNKTLSEKEKVEKKLKNITTEEAKEVAKLNIELQEARKEQKKVAKETLGLVSEYEKLSKQLRENKNEFKDATITGSKTTKELKKMRKEIIKVDKELRDLDNSVNDSFREIGKYSEAIEDLEKDILKVAGALAVGVAAVEGFTSSMNASAEGSEEFREATAQLNAGLDVGKNTVASATLDIIDFTKALIEGDEEALNMAKNFAISTSALRLFMDTSEDTGEFFDRTSNSVENFSENVIKNAEAARIAEASQIALEKTSRILRKRIEELNGEIAIQNIIAGDSTRSFQKRTEAGEKALMLERERAIFLTTIAQQELNILEKQIEARGKGANNLDLLNQKSEKEIELIGLKNELRLAELEINKELIENARDLFEQELDFTLDISDRQKAVNERRIQDERLTLEERTAIFNETTKILNDSFKEQIKLTEGFIAESLEVSEKLDGEEARKRVEAINLERIVGLKDEKQIRKELFGAGIADEITQNRIREIIVERQAATQDLADIERDLNEELRQQQRTLQKDLQILSDVFKGEGLLLDTAVLEQLNTISDELMAIDNDLTLSQEQRVERREEVLLKIKTLEEKSLIDGLTLAREELVERRSILQEELDDIRDGSKEELENREDIARKIQEIDSLITQNKTDELTKQLEAQEEANKKSIELEKEKQAELNELRKEILNSSVELFNESANLVNSVFANQIVKQEAIGAEISRQKEHELILAGDNAERRIEIENEFFKREEANRRRTVELQRKQAIFEKAVAITNATVNTALAVAQINANPAVNADITQTLRTVLTSLVIGIGAAQIGAIAAAPIPQFWKGTDNAPGGMAIVDEKGAEIRTDNKGRIQDMGQGGGARVVMTNPGDKIYTASESKSLGGMLKDNQDILIPGITQQGFNSSRSKLDQLAILEKINNNQIDEEGLTRAFKKAVKTIPINKFFWDENGYNAHREEENSTTKYIDSTKLGG